MPVDAEVDESKCVECKAVSYIVICYHVSAGRVSVPFCKKCGEAFWRKWGATEVGHSASMRDPVSKVVTDDG